MVSKTQGLGPRRPGTSGLWAGVPGSGVPVAQDRAPRAQRDSESLGLGGHRPEGNPGTQKRYKKNTSTRNRTQATPSDRNAGVMNFATTWEWEWASLCTSGGLAMMTRSRNSKLCYYTPCSCPCTQGPFLFLLRTVPSLTASCPCTLTQAADRSSYKRSQSECRAPITSVNTNCLCLLCLHCLHRLHGLLWGGGCCLCCLLGHVVEHWRMGLKPGMRVSLKTSFPWTREAQIQGSKASYHY